jgi:mannosyltransferase OCH1-like enzyme
MSKNNINKVVQSMWHGHELTDMEKLSISSFLYHGHDYHLFVYENLDVPEGVILKDANEIISQKKVFQDFKLKGSFANFSDVFRYKLLLEQGGYWVDTDVICIKPLDFPNNYVVASEKIEKGSDEEARFGKSIPNGCVIKAPMGSDMIDYCYYKSKRISQRNYDWWELGPPLLHEATNKFDLSEHICSPNLFNPISWWEWKDIIEYNFLIKLKLKFRFIQDVYAIHLWSSMWKREKKDKNNNYHPNCLYEKLKKKYL